METKTNNQKRQYTKRNPEFWTNRKNGNSTVTTKTKRRLESSEQSDNPTVFNRYGLQLRTDENLVKKWVDDQIERQENGQYEKFRHHVVPEFQKFLSSLHQSVVREESVSENLIPKSLGTVVSEYSKDWNGESETVLMTFDENCLRTFVGVMSVLEMSGRHILNLEREIVDLKSQLDSRSVSTVTDVEPPNTSDLPSTDSEVRMEDPTIPPQSDSNDETSFSE